VGMITVEILGDGVFTRYEHFANRETATQYVQKLSAHTKSIIIRDSSLEDVFVELTGKKVDED
jgi:ABC-2 type transport system ATP-binding protein